MIYRASTSRRTWLLVPGTAVAMFAIASIVMPVGRDQVGPVPPACGVAPALARFAQDLHDGFWSRRSASLGCFEGALETWFEPASEGRRLCLEGKAREAIAAFQRDGLRSGNDGLALSDLLDTLVLEGQYDLAEWYVREADILLGGGGLRNNLAWHYTQVDIRPETALALALSSVTAEREPFSVDTLAWAYYRNGDLEHAVQTAQEAICLEIPRRSRRMLAEDEKSRDSSRKLLGIIDHAAKYNVYGPAGRLSSPSRDAVERDPFAVH